MNHPAPPSRAAAVALVAGGGLAFATSGPLARYALPAHPLAIVCGRALLAALALALLDGGAALRALVRLPGRARAAVMLAGVVLAAHFTLFVWGLHSTSLPAAVTLVSLEPLCVVAWARVLFGVRPNRLEKLGLLVATLGAAVTGRGAGEGEHRLAGDLLVVASVVLYGLYLGLARSLRAYLPSRQYAALVYAACAVASGLALCVAAGASRFPGLGLEARVGLAPWTLPLHSLVAIALLALIPTLIGHTVVQSAARRVSPTLVGLVSPGETIGAIVLGALWLGAVPTPVELSGAVIILAGVTLAILGASAPAPDNPGAPAAVE